MNIDDLHSWDLSPKTAVALQRDLAQGLVALAALRRLHIEPDALLFAGMGQLHPRRMGIAL